MYASAPSASARLEGLVQNVCFCLTPPRVLLVTFGLQPDKADSSSPLVYTYVSYLSSTLFISIYTMRILG